MTGLRGVIWDVDGTLVDSNRAHAEAWVAAMADHGYEKTVEEILSLIGMGGDNLLPTALDLAAENGVGKAITDRRKTIFKEQHLPHLRAFPQTRELLERMRAAGLTLVVASSAAEEELKALLEIAGATDLIKASTSADDAKHSKPDPDIVLAALQSLGLPPEAAYMLGDTPYDIQAAAKAGVGTIGLRSGGWSDHALADAIATYADPADLLLHYDISPLGAGYNRKDAKDAKTREV